MTPFCLLHGRFRLAISQIFFEFPVHMKIEVFTIADFAADYSGKLSVTGSFDTIFAKSAPVVHPFCSIAVRFRFEKLEEGRKQVQLSVSDMDGRSVISGITGEIVVSVPADFPSQAIQLIVNLSGAKFERFGEYVINLAVDGRHEASLPLFVAQMKG